MRDCKRSSRSTMMFWFVMVVLFPQDSHAQFDSSSPQPLPAFAGSLFLHGGGRVGPEMLQHFTELSGGRKAKIVVIPTADVSDPTDPHRLDAWRECNPSSVELLHATSREQAMLAEFSKTLDDATGIWFSGGKQGYLVHVYQGTPVIDRVRKVLHQGGVVGGVSAGAAIASTPMLIYDRWQEGFAFLPGTIIDQHFFVKNRMDRLLIALQKHTDFVGFGIDEDTALVVRGRRLQVVGNSRVAVCLPKTNFHDHEVKIWEPGTEGDLIALRRHAQTRTLAPFPAAKPKPPKLEKGTLIIAGGGRLPNEVMQQFIESAGGRQSRLVYIPCSEQITIPIEPAMVDEWRRAGAGHVTWLHTKDRGQANDPAFCEPLKTATGIWFGGGRQWNLVDSYQDTLCHALMHEVLMRGGVIGGSSAGASIQGDYMPRGNPLGNTDMMAQGYERGLGFLTGVAIDQHFSQRNRLSDMRALKLKHPQLLGIGIDEGTAIVVRQSQAEVYGTGQVSFFFPSPGQENGVTVSRSRGESLDLIEGHSSAEAGGGR